MHTTLAGADSTTLAAAFNTVYANYVMPLTMSPEQVQRHLTSTNIDLARSPLWLDDTGAVQAMAALGIRDRRGWIGGFGVAVPYRGQGLSHALLQEVVEIATRAGLHQIELEVLVNNPAAIHVYEYGGFQRTGDLLGLRRVAGTPDSATALPLQEIDLAQVLANVPRLRAVASCWQRETESLAASPEASGLLLGDPAHPSAVAAYRATGTDIQILDCAATQPGAIGAVIRWLAGQFPGRHMHLGNEPEDSLVCRALLASGWIEIWRQHRMIRPLAGIFSSP